MRTVVSLAVCVVCFTINVLVGEAIWLNLPASGTKCISEEIHNNVVVLGDYVVVSENHAHIPTISIKVQQLS